MEINFHFILNPTLPLSLSLSPAGADYVAVSTTISFTQSQVEVEFPIQITADDNVELDEVFEVVISFSEDSPISASLDPGVAVVTILDDSPR